MDTLTVVANVAATATAVIAGWAWGWYQFDRCRKRKRLVDYLREEKLAGGDQGQRTLLHLIANLGMSESEIMDAAFRSKVISRHVSMDPQGRADRLFLEYDGDDTTKRKRF
ncbi:MAG: hypothetical protein EOS25_13940 [Mesorhizobium sp.]|uniref:hypothetical protein n=1 Tax=Mesorhizobium sp. TaxID=1871066 RepID=UPI000FE73DA4|nr:hypothetical protein [Mesorhizobium sp.]RWD51230.1 MAG: hypothetical protein EOS59_06485 [Mesorhizobium sp.]RWE60078.1 MAG: hypothetical protein EOS24_13300 [Mesorhizobium sp.]RWF11533.1 MAG: hypothetical protein EOS69_08820 [Mesorhizobium sp.]RWF18431.1 MAG: hypothetical protein EOS25_13940 [Mesorhizobium sp.]TIY05652.1 MAG: hypothetical protein E5V22_06515 [Mesorhizobium sp.]